MTGKIILLIVKIILLIVKIILLIVKTILQKIKIFLHIAADIALNGHSGKGAE